MAKESTGNALPLLKRFWHWMKPHRRFIWWMLLFQILAAPLGIFSPWIISDLIDRQQDLFFWGTILVGLSLLTVLFDLGGGYARTIFDNKMLRDLRLNLYLHMQRLSLRYYNDKETGTLMSRQIDDVGNLQGVLAGAPSSTPASRLAGAGLRQPFDGAGMAAGHRRGRPRHGDLRPAVRDLR